MFLAPWPATTLNGEPVLKILHCVRILERNGGADVLWELQVDMLGPSRALEQIPVKGRLLDHSSMQSIPRSPILFVVRIAIDDLR